MFSFSIDEIEEKIYYNETKVRISCFKGKRTLFEKLCRLWYRVGMKFRDDAARWAEKE